MANRKSTAKPTAARATKTAVEIEAEKKRKAELRAAAQREADEKDEDEDDADDERADEDDKDERDGDDTASQDEDDDSDDERDGDDADGEDDADDADDKRSGAGKRKALTAEEVRKAAEAAVRADRKRGAGIREIAAQFGFPKLGERHANGETSVRAFKDLVMERLLERQKKRGTTTFAAAGEPGVGDETRVADIGATAHGRAFEKGAAEARALLGIK